MPTTIPNDAYAMIIGAMKCGTTSLYNYLQGHPDICPAVVKEPEFFSKNQGHGVCVKNYCDLFSFNNSIHKVALEASTGYAKYPADPNVAKTIFDYGINPKFIYIIRNPFDRIVSHFSFMQEAEPALFNIVNNHTINLSNYFLQLEQYRQFFPIENMLILDFDSLKHNPQQTLKQVYEFLNISADYFPNTYSIENVTYAKRLLTEQEKAAVYERLKDSMTNLHLVYGVDVSKWGF